MALLTSIQPRRGCELCLVLVVVAIHAGRELDLVKRVPALGSVAPRAFHLGMLALQRILRRCMRIHVELRRPPSINVVARRALARIGTLEELPLMRVFVTVGAFGKL